MVECIFHPVLGRSSRGCSPLLAKFQARKRPYLKQKGVSPRDIPGCPLVSVHKRLHRHEHVHTPAHACAHTHTMTQVVRLPVGARAGQYACAGGCVVWSWARGKEACCCPSNRDFLCLGPPPQGTMLITVLHICLCYDRHMCLRLT